MDERKQYARTVNGVLALFFSVKLLLTAASFVTFPLRAWLQNIEPMMYKKAEEELFSADSLSGNLMQMVVYALTVFVPICVYLFLRGQKARVFIENKPFTPMQLLYAVSATGLVGWATTFVTSILFTLFRIPFEDATVVAPSRIPLIPLFLISTAIFPAFAEEFMMRGVALRTVRRSGNGAAILFCAFFFSLLHGNLIQIPFAFTCGLCLTYFALKFQSFSLVVMTHFLINLNACIMQLLLANLEFSHESIAAFVYLMLVMMTVVASCIAGPILYGFRLPEITNKVKGLGGIVFRSPFLYLFLATFVVDLVLPYLF